MINLTWVKSAEGKWLSFLRVNLNNVASDGVYIIWHSGSPSKVVYVGQGDISNRLMAHRSRKDIVSYSKIGELFVTWASVPQKDKDGVERYLADKWRPLVGDAHPNVLPKEVNSPW